MHFFLVDILITNIAHVVRDAHIPQVIIQISISKEGLAAQFTEIMRNISCMQSYLTLLFF